MKTVWVASHPSNQLPWPQPRQGTVVNEVRFRQYRYVEVLLEDTERPLTYPADLVFPARADAWEETLRMVRFVRRFAEEVERHG